MADIQLLVLGGGPGGYAAAFRAADLGLEVLIVESRKTLGGVCLNEGCIPSKALLHVAKIIREAKHAENYGVVFQAPEIDIKKLIKSKDQIVGNLTGGLGGLASRRKVKVVHENGVFIGPNKLQAGDDVYTFEHAIIAVGSRTVQLANWPVHNRIWDSTRALEMSEIPKKLAIVGAGIIGLEMATIYSALGSQVTLIELGKDLLPMVDKDAVNILKKQLSSFGCEFLLGTSVEQVMPSDLSVSLIFSAGDVKEYDVVISSVGRRSNADKIDCHAAGISKNKHDIIDVDEQCRTSVPTIFAVGDVTGMPMLAHRATHQGKVAAEVVCGYKVQMNTSLIPSVAYTDPELAWVGLSLQEAKEQGYKAKTTTFPWLASGRNLASGGNDGLTKLVYCTESNRILGGTIVGVNAGELLAELTLAIEMCATLEDIALVVHAHPTLSETVAFAAERALGTLTDL
ncbi:MAG: dihydrolipoamide dehydrogenase [Marinomonas primoryensis]|jgi:dihydrolipoamide dehydrogenase